jgi:hypothetical protein
MPCARAEGVGTYTYAGGAVLPIAADSLRRWGLVAAGVALLSLLGCAGRRPAVSLPPTAGVGPEAELRRVCPAAFAASVRIRLEPEDGPGATIDGMLRAILPDTLALSARLGIFRPAFALRADADSAELLLHDARRFWVTARPDEDWEALNPSAWARALAWALCPADLFARLDGVEPAGGDDRVRRVRGRLRGSPYLAELDLDRHAPRLVRLRILTGQSLVMELRQLQFRHLGDAWIPGVIEMRMPQHRLSARIEIIGGSTSLPDRPPEVDRLRPPGWAPAGPGETVFPLPEPGHEPG